MAGDRDLRPARIARCAARKMDQLARATAAGLWEE